MHKTLNERLLAYSKVAATGCLEWTGCKTDKGYGRLYFNGGPRLAHRLAYEEWRGPTNDLGVLHRCDNPCCINPEHLFLGTRADNNRDRKEKGRSSAGERHPFSKLTEEQVREIRNSPLGPTALGRIYGVSRGAIRGAKTGLNWSSVQGA